MIKKPITIQIPSRLEARPVALLVQVASQYESEIHVEIGQKSVNAKSIMGMITLACQRVRRLSSVQRAPIEGGSYCEYRKISEQSGLISDRR